MDHGQSCWAMQKILQMRFIMFPQPQHLHSAAGSRWLPADGRPACAAVRGRSWHEDAEEHSSDEARVRVRSAAQARPTLCDPVGSSVRGMLWASILDWVAMPSSRGSS